MTDTVNKQDAVDMLEHESKSAYWDMPARLALSAAAKMIETMPATPSTPVQGYREALCDAHDAIEQLTQDYPNELWTAKEREDWEQVGRDALNGIRQALSQPDIHPSGWIPVSEPPIEREWYLVTDGGAVSYGQWYGDGWYVEDSPFLGDVTHWMQLPVPPGINSTEDDQLGPSEWLIHEMRQAVEQADPSHVNQKQPGERRQKQWERFANGNDPTLPDMTGKWTDEKCPRCLSKVFVSNLGQKRCRCTEEEETDA